MDILPFFDLKKGIQYHKSLFQNPMYLTYVKKCCSCNPNIPTHDLISFLPSILLNPVPFERMASWVIPMMRRGV